MIHIPRRNLQVHQQQRGIPVRGTVSIVFRQPGVSVARGLREEGGTRKVDLQGWG